MDRRGFLIHAARAGSVLLILPAGWAVSGCGNSASSTTTGTPAAPTTNTLRFTSDITQNHTHDFSIATTNLSSPPANGLSGSTTTTLGHFHTVILSPAELAQIQSGGTVNKSTTIVDGHSHNFKFSLTTAQTGTAPSTTGAGGSGTTPPTSGGGY
jgi:hypothetical protein